MQHCYKNITFLLCSFKNLQILQRDITIIYVIYMKRSKNNLFINMYLPGNKNITKCAKRQTFRIKVIFPIIFLLKISVIQNNKINC